MGAEAACTQSCERAHMAVWAQGRASWWGPCATGRNVGFPRGAVGSRKGRRPGVPQPGLISASALQRLRGTGQREGRRAWGGGGGTRNVLSGSRAVHPQPPPPGPFSSLTVPQTRHDILPLSLCLGCSFCLLCPSLPHAGGTRTQGKPERHSWCSPCSVKNRALPPRAPAGWLCAGSDVPPLRGLTPNHTAHQGGACRGQGQAGCPCGSRDSVQLAREPFSPSG